MNHHIRNALQVIELSAHSTRNADAIASITEAVARIEKVLRELVGTGTERPNSVPLRRVS
jgi:C4-dicarboxylate-specific signal transduction histidine kinase